MKKPPKSSNLQSALSQNIQEFFSFYLDSGDVKVTLTPEENGKEAKLNLFWRKKTCLKNRIKKTSRLGSLTLRRKN